MLKFYYGTVSSAKTLNLLATAHSHINGNKKVFLIKPQIDDRFGVDVIKSRAGLELKADLVLSPSGSVFQTSKFWIGSDIILVDEAQFLTKIQIEDLWSISEQFGINVICYGLRADFRTNMFEASKRLFELADSVQEILSTCFFCNRKATQNMRLEGDKPSFDGNSIEISESRFVGACSLCFIKALERAPANKEIANGTNN